jgi:hypothetical protein
MLTAVDAIIDKLSASDLDALPCPEPEVGSSCDGPD